MQNYFNDFFFAFFLADSLEAFGKICFQLLQDVQERLVFRAHLYLQSDILNYKPSAGDLAYPDKLEMMQVRLKKKDPKKLLGKTKTIIV